MQLRQVNFEGHMNQSLLIIVHAIIQQCSLRHYVKVPMMCVLFPPFMEVTCMMHAILNHSAIEMKLGKVHLREG